MDKRLLDYLESLGAPADALDGWEIHTAQRAGVDCAFVITRGAELHFVSISGKHAMSRRNIAQYIQPILDKFGYASTRVPVAETNHRLRYALGFKCFWFDDNFTYWTLTQAPYARTQNKGASPCQSQ
jgi:hypothetical protein